MPSSSSSSSPSRLFFTSQLHAITFSRVYGFLSPADQCRARAVSRRWLLFLRLLADLKQQRSFDRFQQLPAVLRLAVMQQMAGRRLFPVCRADVDNATPLGQRMERAIERAFSHFSFFRDIWSRFESLSQLSNQNFQCNVPVEVRWKDQAMLGGRSRRLLPVTRINSFNVIFRSLEALERASLFKLWQREPTANGTRIHDGDLQSVYVIVQDQCLEVAGRCGLKVTVEGRVELSFVSEKQHRTVILCPESPLRFHINNHTETVMQH